MGDLWQDLKYGARVLRKEPAFATVAILILALGIGANTAVFSAVKAILLQPLPVPQPQQLVLFADSPSEGTGISTGGPHGGVWERFSFDAYRYFAEHVAAVQDLAAFRSGESRVSVLGEGRGSGAQLARCHLVSGNYFSVLRVGALRGRTLTRDDDAASAAPAAVISYGYWRTRWGGDPTVVGDVVTINRQPFTIVGVMPESFYGLRVRRAPDFWVPLRFQPQIEQRESFLANRDAYWLGLAGRLAPGADLAQAQAAVDLALRQFLVQQAGAEPNRAYGEAIERASIRLAPGGRGLSYLRWQYTEPLRVLAAVAALVLLIACANIANVLLARATARREELAMRVALGASRWRLVRQLLRESMLLAGIGGGTGLLLAQWGVSAIKTVVVGTSPVDVGVSLPGLGFGVAVSVLAGSLVGLAPAIRAGRSDIASSLRERAGSAAGGRLRPGLPAALVVGQVALSLALLVGSGLLVRSLANLMRQDLGFEREGVLLVDLDARLAGYSAPELHEFYRRLLERIRRVPGVRAATVASYSPMSGASSTQNVWVEGFTPPQGEDMCVGVDLVGPGYAETLALPVVLGREFDERDGALAPPVAMVNQAFVRAFFPGQNPVGRRFGFGDNPAESEPIEIVGVVADARYQNPREPPVRMAFRPVLQSGEPMAYQSELEVRTAGAPTALAPVVQAAIAEVDSWVPVAGATTLSEQLHASLRQERLLTQSVTAFGTLAVVLACVGLYGVVSQAVARRTGELGIRMALGATAGDVLRMVLREAGAVVAVGIVVGIPAALTATRLIRSQLFGVTPADPLTVAGTALLLGAVAMVAGYVPARRASRVDPAVALRAEWRA